VAGRGRAVAGPDGIELSWSFTAAARVEAVTEDDGRFVLLDRLPDGSHSGRLSSRSAPGVALLVSLADGRTSWDWLETEQADA
jgi:hypothetical protein